MCRDFHAPIEVFVRTTSPRPDLSTSMHGMHGVGCLLVPETSGGKLLHVASPLVPKCTETVHKEYSRRSKPWACRLQDTVLYENIAIGFRVGKQCLAVENWIGLMCYALLTHHI